MQPNVLLNREYLQVVPAKHLDYEQLAETVLASAPYVDEYIGFPEVQQDVAFEAHCGELSEEQRVRVLGFLATKPEPRRGISVIGAMHLREEL